MSANANQDSGLERKNVSRRKVEANRRNASKSTGPKTSRGKAYSRRNANEHGLFAMGPFMFDSTNREKHTRYKDLLDRLSTDYNPVGVAEELEVQRIAVCWWKLGRAWRCENAAITAELGDFEIHYERRTKPNTISSEDQARLVLLRKALVEIDSADTISAELRETMFANDPEFQKEWESLERAVKRKLH